MYQILTLTPFGFVMELTGNTCYRTEKPYEVCLNGRLHYRGSERVISIFGLEPDTLYNVELRGAAESDTFDIRTEKAGFVITVRDYNASGDGESNDTSAVNAAVYTAPYGSVVRFPRGIYAVDQILLKSGVDLYLEPGAIIRQNTDRDSLAVLKGYQKDYDFTDVTVNASWEGHPLDCFCSLIYGKEVENIHIYGHGAIDGNGRQGGWWLNPKQKDRGFRPRNIFLAHCRDITISGVTSQNSAAWNIHPFYSSKLAFYGLEIKSSPDSPNTDGLNPESCEDVDIVGCHFQVGDDCIAIKSGKLYMSRRHYRPCRNIRIRGCFMEKGHGGIVIGSEMSCGVENVEVSNCLLQGTDRGLRIKTRRGRGNKAVVDGVSFSNVEMDGVKHCFVVNMFYNCDPDGHSDYVCDKTPLPVDEWTPAVRNISILNVAAKDITGSGVFIYGLPESMAEHITIRDSSFDFASGLGRECPAMMDSPVIIPDLGIFIQNAKDVQMENNRFTGQYVSQINGMEAAQ